LTGYEMEWTVRYFQHRSRTWAMPASTGTGTSANAGHTLSAGAVAYRSEKCALWEDLMLKADHTFARFN
ncbi:hypothetical protein BYT27DRAFT_7052016, partial [Phlegmacium glaucopus]